MFEKLATCPSCGSSSFENYLICQDHMVTKEYFNLVKCHDCDLIFTNPRPASDNINKYYESEEYISHTNTTKSFKDILYKAVRAYSLKSKIKLINQLSTSRNLLDYGCGTGHFINKALKSGWTVQEVEHSRKALIVAGSNLNSYIHTYLNSIDSYYLFVVVTLWHVLEHVHDLSHTLQSIKQLTHSKGSIVIAVPNLNSYDAQLYKEHWAGYDVPRHLYHFTQSSMHHLMKANGFKIKKVLPMVFDSYYVSLLSERYKTNKTHYLHSFINGYKSNTYARKTGEFSSLIYIINIK